MGSVTNGNFCPRAPRFTLRTPVSIQLPGGTVKGRSINVSESGMLAALEQFLDAPPPGRLFAAIGEEHISIDVSVVRVEGTKVGLNFRVASESDRIAIQKLVDRAMQAAASAPAAAPMQN